MLFVSNIFNKRHNFKEYKQSHLAAMVLVCYRYFIGSNGRLICVFPKHDSHSLPFVVRKETAKLVKPKYENNPKTTIFISLVSIRNIL